MYGGGDEATKNRRLGKNIIDMAGVTGYVGVDRTAIEKCKKGMTICHILMLVFVEMIEWCKKGDRE